MAQKHLLDIGCHGYFQDVLHSAVAPIVLGDIFVSGILCIVNDQVGVRKKLHVPSVTGVNDVIHVALFGKQHILE